MRVKMESSGTIHFPSNRGWNWSDIARDRYLARGWSFTIANVGRWRHDLLSEQRIIGTWDLRGKMGLSVVLLHQGDGPAFEVDRRSFGRL